MDKRRRKFFGDCLMGIANLHEAQALGLSRLYTQNIKELSSKERKAVRMAIAYLDKSNRCLRVLSNHLTQ